MINARVIELLAASTQNESFTLDPVQIRDISAEVLDEDGRLRVLPAAYWVGTTAQERGLLGHRFGLYSFPTVELVDHLRTFIGDRSAIEIGAGHGVLAQALGVPATDNFMQNKDPYRTLYALRGQTTVPYGPNVEDCHASRAVRKYRPKVVIGCWVTHKWDPRRPDAGGNEVGVDEEDILKYCEHYVIVGNEKVHEAKKIWSRPHVIEYPDFVYSRTLNGSRDFIATWPGSAKQHGTAHGGKSSRSSR